ESNFRSLLQSGLGKLDLVTREEFNIQTKVLERTREKLERLERELEELQATDLNVDTQKSGNG
ncbi:MAG: accessory factor UbiK family protein, partial [Gammaproteobacteria bacterium]|nr:accessory factor UbiK family protein [Gammaproteobacteria bacterium]